ncbi:unnamed protein product [Mytilus edulis]|uniref:C-terminal of Roc (COR) domain-containing protein n=1 Tax=Mytilus edulis TaxID=6550 RepID=A0A8S3UCS9_MYTED|nr:unnamed protein product [Mytilus edulis]
MRSSEITSPVTVTLSEEMLDLIAENSGDETADLSLTPDDEITDLDAGKCIEEMIDPGGAESSYSFRHEKKKKSKLKSFFSLPKFIQKALKGKSTSNNKTPDDRSAGMEGTMSDDDLVAMDMSEDDIFRFLRSECNKGNYEMVIVPIDLWDFGGQKVYQMTHQLFITSRGTFLLIFNGSKEINEEIPDYTELPGCQGQRNTAVYLIHWVNSVLTYCKTLTENEEYQKIKFVATHKDQVKGDVEEQRCSLENSIEKLFQNHGGKKHLQYKPLIFVDARNKEDEELTTLKKQLVEVALDHPRCGELMPTKFVPLELQLAKMVEENKKILTMGELNDQNEQNEQSALSPNQLKKFLKVNHALGKLIYFDEACLRDKVIIDPVFLVDVLRSIVTDEQFWPEHLKEILTALKESGKLFIQDLFEIWRQKCFSEILDHKDYMVEMLVHLDIICRQKSDDERSEFFLVPCMISTKREESQQIDHDRSIHLAYRFKEEVVPPAILYRFIATFISMWKLRVSAKSSRLMIFTDSADVTIDRYHDMRFDIRGNRFIVSLTHKDKKISIVPTIASTAQECLTHAITNISNFYFSVSEDSDCTRDLPFNIQIGIVCGTELCFFDHTLSSKEEWTCPDHNRKHMTNLVSKWFADKFPTEGDRCPEDCSGLDNVWLERWPEDKHIGRLASKMTGSDTRKIYMRLKEKEPALSWEIINESNQRGGFDMKMYALYDWKKSTQYPSFKELERSLKKEDIDIHKLCQITREVQKEFDQPKERLIRRPSTSNIQKLPDHIGNQTFQLGIELGLSVVQMQQIAMNHVRNLRSQTEEVLKTWRRLPEATYEVLAKALHRLDLSSVLAYLTYDVGQEEQVEDRIIHDIVISQILDYMMTHLVISPDDRRSIEQHVRQDDQNKALLHEVNKGRAHLFGLSEWTVPVYKVRLQKNYSKIIDNIQHETIVDHLISRDVLTIADSQMINACPAQIQKNRKLIDILLHRSENGFLNSSKLYEKTQCMQNWQIK